MKSVTSLTIAHLPERPPAGTSVKHGATLLHPHDPPICTDPQAPPPFYRS